MHVGSRTMRLDAQGACRAGDRPEVLRIVEPLEHGDAPGAGDRLGDRGQWPAVGGGDRAAVEVEADGRRQHRSRRHVHRGVEGVEASREAGQDLRRDEHRTDPMPRLEQPLDRRDALGDEHLVALVPALRGGIGELDVVDEAGISGVVDGLGHGRSLTGLTVG